MSMIMCMRVTLIMTLSLVVMFMVMVRVVVVVALAPRDAVVVLFHPLYLTSAGANSSGSRSR
jgi:hypothetical protein